MSYGRVLVGLALLCFTALIGPVPATFGGAAPLLIGFMAAVDFLLIVHTRGAAFRWGVQVDERQADLRDRAYRLAFRLAGLALVLILAAAFLTAFSSVFQPGSFVEQRDASMDGLGARLVFAVIELFLMLPTFVIVLVQEDGADKVPATRGRRLRIGALTAVVGLAMAVLVSGVDALPSGSGTRSFNPDPQTGGSDRCAHFVSTQYMGWGLGDAVRMRAEVCWNGRVAFVSGTVLGLDAPPGVTPDTAFVSPFMKCGPDSDQHDFVATANHGCWEAIDRQGSVDYAATVDTSSILFGLFRRQTRMELVVSNDGRVLLFDRT